MNNMFLHALLLSSCYLVIVYLHNLIGVKIALLKSLVPEIPRTEIAVGVVRCFYHASGKYCLLFISYGNKSRFVT